MININIALLTAAVLQEFVSSNVFLLWYVFVFL